MKLPSASLKRPVTTLMALVAVIVFGAVSLLKLPIDLLPNLELPYAIVMTSYTGAGPREVESLVTRTVESAMGSVSGISNITSQSAGGSSIVMCEFSSGTDMNFAVLDIREKLDLIKGYLPEEASTPMVLTINMDMLPVTVIAVSGPADIADVQETVEDDIVPMFERLDGVAEVATSGGRTERVEIRTRPAAMRGYGLSINYLMGVLAGQNLSLPAGQVTQGSAELAVRTTGEFASVEELRSALIPLPMGGSMPLSSVAEVTAAYEESGTIARVNGDECFGISITKRSGTNTVEVARQVEAQIETVRAQHPDLTFTVVMSQAIYIEAAIKAVTANILQGALLAVLILYVFLRSIGMTTLISISIPSSVITTFTLLYFFDITLNIVTLGGLALGVGMMVDNSIVVLENIYRIRREGLPPAEAARQGAEEVAMAVTASTLTTVAVFLPIVFMEGITANIFKELALTVAMSLLASLLVSLTLVPLLSVKLLPTSETIERLEAKKKGDGPIMKAYKRLLVSAMNHRLITCLVALGIFIASVAPIAFLGSEYFPSTDQGTLSVTVAMPDGTAKEELDEVASGIGLMAAGLPEVREYFVTSGGMMGLSTSPTATITVNLLPLSERDRSADEVAEVLRGMVGDIAGAEITVAGGEMSMDTMLGSDIDITIKGPELEELTRIAGDVAAIAKEVPGAADIEAGLQQEVPEIEVRVDGEAASRFGLTTATISQTVKSAVSGTTATRLKIDGTEKDVVILGEDVAKKGIEGLADIQIAAPTGAVVPLDLVADIAVSSSPAAISRIGQVRAVQVTGAVSGEDIGAVNDEIAAKLEGYSLPQGYTIEMGGQSVETAEAFGDLALALGLAVILVFLVLASQFESLILPFPIILTVPLGMSGGLLALLLAGKPMSVPGYIGLIMLAGIVVNNAIVLVDYIITRRKAGEDRLTATLAAGPIRLRPVLMTTLTTVLGLVPLALGLSDGGELMAPLAIAMIGGLSLSTVMTLVVVPVFYSLFDDARMFGRKKKRGAKQEEPEPAPL
ncbi:MAG TPA: efflux RND transporter permease subunit [Candidatus Acidoferrum sp.]|nr:efflux RND transporter permease subunit [Candidatus Acidoferrum sp.]